jgi:hypothetical protein
MPSGLWITVRASFSASAQWPVSARRRARTVVDPAIEPAPRVCVIAEPYGGAHEIRERAGSLLVKIVIERKRQAFFLQRAARNTAGAREARAHVVQRVTERIDRSDPARHVDRQLAERGALRVLPGQHVELRSIAQRHRELFIVAEWREDVERLLRAPSRLGVVTEEPREARQPSKVAANRPRVVELTPEGERLGPGVARRAHVAREVAFVGELVHERRAHGGVDAISPRERGTVV